MDKKFYGLIIPKKTAKLEKKSVSIFESSDEETDALPRLKKKTDVTNPSSKILAKNKTLQKKLEKDDPTIYEYDNIYDSIKQNQTEKQKTVIKEGPKYITNLLKAADKRKKEQERRQERKIQTEREKEGDEYKDKEAFVTSAYKKKMMEMQEEEEREKLQDQIDEMMDVTKQKDLSGFYRHYLKQTVGEEEIPEFGDREAKIKELSERIKKSNSPTLTKDDTQNSVKESENLDAEFRDKGAQMEVHSEEIKKSNSPTLNEKDIQNNAQDFENLDADSYSSDNESNDDDAKIKKNMPKPSSCSTLSDETSQDKSAERISKVKFTKKRNTRSNSSDLSASETETIDKASKSLKSSKKAFDKSPSKDNEHDSSSKEKDGIKRKISESLDQSSKKLKQGICRVSLDYDHDSQDNEILHSDNDDTNKHSDDNTGVETTVKQTKPKRDIRLIFVKRTVGELFDQAQKRYFQRMAAKS